MTSPIRSGQEPNFLKQAVKIAPSLITSLALWKLTEQRPSWIPNRRTWCVLLLTGGILNTTLYVLTMLRLSRERFTRICANDPQLD